MIICNITTYQETLIAHLVDNFRSSFPTVTAPSPLKCTCLKNTQYPWARRTHVGFDVLGEQGAEFIHARFNTLQRTYDSVPDNIQLLLLIVKEHLLSVAPQNVVLVAIPLLSE